MEELGDTRQTYEGKWQGYPPGTALPEAIVHYMAKHHKEPRYWAKVPNLLLLGPIEERTAEVTP